MIYSCFFKTKSLNYVKINSNLTFQVASGLPDRCIDKKHVSEIATMALDLLHASSYFKIPHSTHEKLQIRIGLHTGPCGAGIVGTKMPRYCLFGNASHVLKF